MQHVSLQGCTYTSHKLHVEVATWVGSEPHRALVTLSAAAGGGGSGRDHC